MSLGLFLPLVAALSLFSYLQYVNQQALLMENLRRSATNAGDIVEGGLKQAMLRNDFSDVQQIMDDIVGQEGVLDLFLMNKQGQVVLSAGRQSVAVTMPLSDATCQACHRYEAASRRESVILTDEEGMRVFRNVNAVENPPECQGCHTQQERTSGVLITDFSMENVDGQLATLGRDSLLWSGASIIVILLIVNLMTSRMVISRLERFAKAIKRTGEGDLDPRLTITGADEIGELAHSFNGMADGLKEKQKLERKLRVGTKTLQAQAEKLSVLNALAATVSESLDLKEILDGGLKKVLELTKLTAGWVVLRDSQGAGLQLAASRGLSEEMARAVAQGSWDRCGCEAVLQRARLEVPDSWIGCPCVAEEHVGGKHPIIRTCVPLRAKNQILGVMSLIGDASGDVLDFTGDMPEMLAAVGQQIGIAVENARLWDELRQKEDLRRQLLERLIAAQEEERKRISRELHDETGQALTSLIVKLQVLERLPCPPEVLGGLEDLRAEAAGALDKVHDLALELRPSVLDDLGLVAALRRYCRDYETRSRLPVDFQAVGLGRHRLPSLVETTLYRIVQEALTNIASHAQARSVSVLLEKRGPSVIVVVEDDGKGFDVAQVMGSRVQSRNLGLHGMRERASLLGGMLTIESSSDTGTAIFVEIPMEYENGDDEENQTVAG